MTMDSEYKYPEERWWGYSFAFQISNIGTELQRTIRYKKKHKSASTSEYLKAVYWQIDYTLRDPKNKDKIEELSKAEADVRKYFSYKRYWFLEKKIIRYFDSYIEEYVKECRERK